MTHEDVWARLRAAFDEDGVANFTPDEFVPLRAKVPPEGIIHRLTLIARVVQDLRDYSGGRVNLTNAYRDPEYNSRVGGARNSQHMKCTAADVVAVDMTPSEVYKWAEKHRWAQFMGLGRYRSFTHMDVRGFYGDPAPARWDKRERDIS